MKVQVKYKWPWGEGSIYGDVTNIVEEWNPLKKKFELRYMVKTLDFWLNHVTSAQIMRIWPYQGEYMSPNLHLMKKREWQKVPRSKIRWAKKKRGGK